MISFKRDKSTEAERPGFKAKQALAVEVADAAANRNFRCFKNILFLY